MSFGIIEIIILLIQVFLLVIVVAVGIALGTWFVRTRQPSTVGMKNVPIVQR